MNSKTESMPVAVRVERDGKVLLQAIVAVDSNETFLNVVQRALDQPLAVEQVQNVFAGVKSFDRSDLFDIPAQSFLSDCGAALDGCSKILFVLSSDIQKRPPVKNAFADLMKNAAMLKLPEEKVESDGRSCIHNRIVQYLRERKVGFRPFQKTEMDAFMTAVGAALWQLDGNWNKFFTASNVRGLPESLHFVPEGRDSFRILHHGNQKKKTTPQLRSDELLINYERLELLTTKRYLQAEDWKSVFSDVIQLKDSIGDYLRHISKASDSKTAQGRALENSDPENRILKLILPVVQRDEIVKLRYKDLEERLLAVPKYTELNMIFAAPMERRLKHKFIVGIQLDFAVNLYRTYRPNATFVWRVDLSDSDMKSAMVVARIEKDLLERVRADKVKKLEETYGGVAVWTKSKVLELAVAAQEDESPPDDVIQAGYKLLLDEGYEVSEVVKLEKEAAACSTGKFSNFWDSVSKVLAANDYTVAEERRHGETSWISPLCVSLNDLMRTCEVEMERIFPGSPMNFVPSYEYFRLQFVPRNSRSEVSKRYYGRFDVKFGLQKRTLHKSHVDQHFGAKQFQFLKAMPGKFCDHSLAFFLDDKASIPVGFVGAPVSATRRQRSVLMAGLDDRGLNAMDHDNIPQHLVPSVAIKLIPPKELSDSWYCGKPMITLKDAIFQPSSAFRHAAEVVKHLAVADHSRPMMFFGTDGGPDHNVTSIQVMLSYVSIFIELDLDFLAAARTPPNFSVVNPAERFMSVANLALVGVSLSRNDLGADEKKVKSFMSKKQWRDAYQKRPDIDYPQLALAGTKDARMLLADRFERLTYKGEKVQVGEPATEEEIFELKESISALFDIDFSTPLLKSKVLSIPAVRDFFADHVRCTKYTFQVKKCTKKECRFHQQIRLPSEVFDDVHWVPSPELKGDLYLNFDVVYGREPTDKDVPSLNTAGSTRSDELSKPPFPLAHTRARMIVRCTECDFPRLLYTKYGIDKALQAKLEVYFEERLFVCGADLPEFPDVFQNRKLSCRDPVSLHYYQTGSALSGFIPLCAKCLCDEVTRTPNKILYCEKCCTQTPKPVKVFQKRGRPKIN